MTLKDKLKIISEMERRNNDRWKGGENHEGKQRYSGCSRGAGV